MAGERMNLAARVEGAVAIRETMALIRNTTIGELPESVTWRVRTLGLIMADTNMGVLIMENPLAYQPCLV